MRKKVSTNVNAAAAAVDLDDDEQFVEEVTTTRKVGRQRRPAEVSDNSAIRNPQSAIEFDDTDDDAIDIDDDGEPIERPAFSETSLAALIEGNDGQEYDSQFCTIAIRRKPDSMNDKFLNPCGAVTNLPPLRNVELSADRMDIEDRVRAEYGGGHYFFQIHFDNRLRASWQATLSDDPAAVANARAASTNPASAAAAPAAAVDPIDAMIRTMRQQRELREELFGDKEKEYDRQIAELKAELERNKLTPGEPPSERMAMLERALAAQSPELQDRLLNHLFPADDEGSRHWIADVADVVIQNKDTIMGLIGSLFGGMPPPAPQPAAAPLDDLFRQPMPEPTGEIAGFRRRPIDAPSDDFGNAGSLAGNEGEARTDDDPIDGDDYPWPTGSVAMPMAEPVIEETEPADESAFRDPQSAIEDSPDIPIEAFIDQPPSPELVPEKSQKAKGKRKSAIRNPQSAI